ncbi:hypothetical protein ODJ79_31825 [Actinoplanes sp. KI2]|uniref:hypothetical protein n=1 Tax=Actinoplanes sp. KI2 TaxID=2983315 RepID=UPI0021D5D4D7|nr:hypothetical protein [Actinoplanes sp. KI2]MCU7728326.1 hypothetical protein [Actinoplanes sp. KI2]
MTAAGDCVTLGVPDFPVQSMSPVNDIMRTGTAGAETTATALGAGIEFEDPAHHRRSRAASGAAPARAEARRYREGLAGRLVALSTALAGAAAGPVPGQRLTVLIDAAYTNAAHLGPDGLAAAGLRLARQLVTDAEQAR